MDRFVVPQFIDVEPKIFGPVTVRQFVISLVGIFLLVAAYKLADFGLFILEALVIATLVFLFGFYKVNGRSFHLFLLNILETLKRPSIRVWRPLKKSASMEETATKTITVTPSQAKFQRSRLKELTLLIDTGGVYRPD
jgi:hypothetical protein